MRFRTPYFCAYLLLGGLVQSSDPIPPVARDSVVWPTFRPCHPSRPPPRYQPIQSSTPRPTKRSILPGTPAPCPYPKPQSVTMPSFRVNRSRSWEGARYCELYFTYFALFPIFYDSVLEFRLLHNVPFFSLGTPDSESARAATRIIKSPGGKFTQTSR